MDSVANGVTPGLEIGEVVSITTVEDLPLCVTHGGMCGPDKVIGEGVKVELREFFGESLMERGDAKGVEDRAKYTALPGAFFTVTQSNV